MYQELRLVDLARIIHDEITSFLSVRETAVNSQNTAIASRANPARNVVLDEDLEYTL